LVISFDCAQERERGAAEITKVILRLAQDRLSVIVPRSSQYDPSSLRQAQGKLFDCRSGCSGQACATSTPSANCSVTLWANPQSENLS
jgi:hypothetical protein